MSAYDTNPHNVAGTSFLLQDNLLAPLAQSACRRALVFIDACAQAFREVVPASRHVISNLHPEEGQDLWDGAWYCGVFLSCSPGEKSYPADALGHGIWTAHLLRALRGEAEDALTSERWLTDFGLRDWLAREVPRYITRELTIRGTQTPQAILSGSNTFDIRYIPVPPTIVPNAALSCFALRSRGEYLEGFETGAIRQLDGFSRDRRHTVPTQLSDSANGWVQRLLEPRIKEELQEIYNQTKATMNLRRRDLRMETDTGGGDLDTIAFRYSIQAKQNPADPREWKILRRLELRQGWMNYRDAIDSIFGEEFSRVVVEFELGDITYDQVVEGLEDIVESIGGVAQEVAEGRKASYISTDGAKFTFDVQGGRLAISFGQSGCLSLVDGVRAYKLGVSGTTSALLVASPSPVPEALQSTASREPSSSVRRIRRT